MAHDQRSAQALSAIKHLSTILQQNKPLESFWPILSDALNDYFTHTSCTVLTYDRETKTLGRLYSSRPDINRIGGRKRVTDSFWSRKVLDRGEILIGSNREDIKTCFSEYQLLWSHGWESILNIPVRSNGRTIGSINIMNRAGAYDDADLGMAIVFAQLAVGAIERGAEALELEKTGDENLEYV